MDVAAWGDASVPADLAISAALELSLDEIAEHVDPTATRRASTDGDGPGTGSENE